ncbi:MAG TPA: hypothetical protein VGC70_02985 [Burkholderiales bacterium]|jgi:outer membrane murein-binding lipoprotein Lpp
MNKLIAAVVVSTFALASASTFAADSTKKDELTVEQRSELRARADQMKVQRDSTPVQKDKVERKAHSAKHSALHHTHKAKKMAKRDARKIRRHA